jgi:putative transposase
MTTSSYESLSHSKWDGKYHVVFIPKGRKKALYGKIRRFLGPVLRELAGQRGSTIVEGHMVQDHVHMLIRIPPQYAVAEVIGSIKGKSAIAVARQAALRGKRVAALEPAAYGGSKDVNEAWMAGVLHLGVWPAAIGAGPGAVPENLCEDWAERAAIMVADGGLPPAEAERLAWIGLHAT